MLNVQNFSTQQNYTNLKQNQSRGANPNFGQYFALTKEGYQDMKKLLNDPEAYRYYEILTNALSDFRATRNRIDTKTVIPVDRVSFSEKRTAVKGDKFFSSLRPKEVARQVTLSVHIANPDAKASDIPVSTVNFPVHIEHNNPEIGITSYFTRVKTDWENAKKQILDNFETIEQSLNPFSKKGEAEDIALLKQEGLIIDNQKGNK